MSRKKTSRRVDCGIYLLDRSRIAREIKTLRFEQKKNFNKKVSSQKPRKLKITISHTQTTLFSNNFRPQNIQYRRGNGASFNPIKSHRSSTPILRTWRIIYRTALEAPGATCFWCPSVSPSLQMRTSECFNQELPAPKPSSPPSASRLKVHHSHRCTWRCTWRTCSAMRPWSAGRIILSYFWDPCREPNAPTIVALDKEISRFW